MTVRELINLTGNTSMLVYYIDMSSNELKQVIYNCELPEDIYDMEVKELIAKGDVIRVRVHDPSFMRWLRMKEFERFLDDKYSFFRQYAYEFRQKTGVSVDTLYEVKEDPEA